MSSTGSIASPATGARVKLIAALELMRLHNCVLAAIATLLGARLVSPGPVLQNALVVRAGLVVLTIVALGNVVNDLADERADAINKPGRPIPSGRISRTSASRLAIALAALSLGLAASLGPVFGTIAAGLMLVSLAYSYRLKGTVLLGNAVVAGLGASTVVFGAAIAGGLNRLVLFAGLMVFLFMLGYEVLKTLPDRDGDEASGLTTVATRFGAQGSLRVFYASNAGFLAAALLPWVLGLASNRYLAVVLIGTVAPTAFTISMLHRRVTPGTVTWAIWVEKAAWVSGLVAIAMLRG